MAKKTKKLPGTIFVYQEPDGDDFFLMLYESLAEAAEAAAPGTLIGTYDLSYAGKYTVEKSVVEE